MEPARAADAGACARAALGAITRHGYGRVHIFDFHGSIGRGEGFEVRPCSTRIVSLEAPDWPEDPKLRSQIRKAGREGISVVPYDPARHRAGLLALVARTFRHHGLRPRYPASFYDALAALAARDPRVIWRWCERDGEPASSHIYFVEGDMLLAWQSYFDRRFSFLKPNVHIRHGAAREAAARGVRWLNLGATPETATGLAYFKARWGGRRVSFASLAQLTGPAAAFEGWRARRRIERVRDVLGPAKALR